MRLAPSVKNATNGSRVTLRDKMVELHERDPTVLSRVVQHSGEALLERMHTWLSQHESFTASPSTPSRAGFSLEKADRHPARMMTSLALLDLVREEPGLVEAVEELGSARLHERFKTNGRNRDRQKPLTIKERIEAADLEVAQRILPTFSRRLSRLLKKSEGFVRWGWSNSVADSSATGGIKLRWVEPDSKSSHQEYRLGIPTASTVLWTGQDGDAKHFSGLYLHPEVKDEVMEAVSALLSLREDLFRREFANEGFKRRQDAQGPLRINGTEYVAMRDLLDAYIRNQVLSGWRERKLFQRPTTNVGKRKPLDH